MEGASEWGVWFSHNRVGGYVNDLDMRDRIRYFHINDTCAKVRVPIKLWSHRASECEKILAAASLDSNSFGTGVHGQHHVVAKDVGDFLREDAKERIVERARGECELLSLRCQSSYNARVTMTLCMV